MPYPALRLSPITNIVVGLAAWLSKGVTSNHIAHSNITMPRPSSLEPLPVLKSLAKFVRMNPTRIAIATVLSADRLAKQVNSPEGTLTILDDVSFSIVSGETVAIVGASGAGKSTLLALLAGLDAPSSGTVQLNGAELTALDEDGRAAVRAQHVGFVFQSFHLVPSLTALENVMLPLELAGKPNARAAALAALDNVGLASRNGHYPKQLSGGEQQRVAIARAFVTHPAVLFADEPTGNLDKANGEKVMNLLFEMNAARGTTLVLVTHDPQLAERCQRVIRLDNGKVVS
jgi:putative ABC transport system ATP-binding protein